MSSPSPLLCRSTNVETKRKEFLMLNPPIDLIVPAYTCFLNAVDKDEGLFAEVDALFTEYENEVPSFWFTSPFESLYDPSARSLTPVMYEDSQPPSKSWSGNTKLPLATCQVFGISIEDDPKLSEHPIHQEFYGKFLNILERFDK